MMNRKSILDRDNVEFYIMSEEDEKQLAKILLEENGWVDVDGSVDELPKLQPWQEEILTIEFGDAEK
jgi:hypothetical protein